MICIYYIMTEHFPLPRATQECYTKWYNYTVTSGALKNYTILWAARELDCRFRSDNVKDIIGPQHVFILKLNKMFEYAVIDSTETVYRLPKKYYTSCFPGVQYNQVPKNNRMVVRLSGRQRIELPYIPSSFLEQKKTKTNRKRRRTDSNTSERETINFNTSSPDWVVLNNKNNEMSNKKDLLHLIRSVIHFCDDNEGFTLKNMFEGIKIEDIQKNDELKEKLKVIITFIYYYCREELGCFHKRDPMNINDVQTWISELNSSGHK
jgi:hypothetical protein